jgi:hypothetical protein
LGQPLWGSPFQRNGLILRGVLFASIELERLERSTERFGSFSQPTVPTAWNGVLTAQFG